MPCYPPDTSHELLSTNPSDTRHTNLNMGATVLSARVSIAELADHGLWLWATSADRLLLLFWILFGQHANPSSNRTVLVEGGKVDSTYLVQNGASAVRACCSLLMNCLASRPRQINVFDCGSIDSALQIYSVNVSEMFTNKAGQLFIEDRFRITSLRFEFSWYQDNLFFQ